MPMYPPQSARSINPFDVNVQSSAQAPTVCYLTTLALFSKAIYLIFLFLFLSILQ